MEKETNKARIESRLALTEEQIKRRIDGLENEIVSTPAAVRDAIRKNPWLGVGAAVAAGAVVGLIFGGRKNKSAVPPAHQALVTGYINAVAEEVRKGIRRGKDAEDVVRESLRDRTPVIVYAPETPRSKAEHAGFLRQLGDLTLKTALGFAVKTAIDFFTASLNVKELQSMLMLEEEEERRSGREPNPRPGGDGAPETPPIENTPIDH